MVAVDTFEKRYPSEAMAEIAWHRSQVARLAGVTTPAVLGRNGLGTLSFERIISAVPPTLAEMLAALRPLRGMPADGLIRFDPFLRIRPRLGTASPQIRAWLDTLAAQDGDLRWSALTVIHGDFHPGQTLRDADGRTWLLDLDDLALAPAEADLGNLAAWMATSTIGILSAQADTATKQVLTLWPGADPALTRHFCNIALVRRALKLAGKGQPWALDQLPLRM